MTLVTDNLATRIQIIEHRINQLQTALNNVPNKKQNNSIFVVVQKQIAELQQEITLINTKLAQNQAILPITSSAGVIYIDGNTSNNFSVQITEPITDIGLKNIGQDRVITIYLQQDAIGGHAISIASPWIWLNGQPAWNTAANSWSKIVLSIPDGATVVATGYTQ